MKFTVGQAVEIKTKWRSNLLGVDFEYPVFKGTVVPNPKWLGPDYVSVNTGNPEYPVSHILISKIIGAEGVLTNNRIRIFEVLSKSKGKKYTVTVSADKVDCDCIGFTYRHTCKHSQKVKDHVFGKVTLENA